MFTTIWFKGKKKEGKKDFMALSKDLRRYITSLSTIKSNSTLFTTQQFDRCPLAEVQKHRIYKANTCHFSPQFLIKNK